MVVAIYANSGFLSYTGGVYTGCPANANTLVNHAVLLYGFDSQGNWLIKNSWGTTWG